MEGCVTTCDIYTSTTSFPLRVVVSTLLLSLHISLHSRVSAKDGQIRCNVLSAKLHGNTLLTCHFPEDVSITRKEFGVYRYTDKSNPDEVLDCWWMLGKVECRNDHGYEYNKTISDRLSLEILGVSAPQVATYACHLAGYRPESINTCDLNAELDGRSICEIPSVKLKSQTALTCYFPEDLSKTRADFYVTHHSTLGVSVRVLSCTWTGDNVTCSTPLGYLFDKKVTSHLTLQIPSALESHEGTFSCETNGAVSSKTCSFTLDQGDGFIAKPKSACNISSVKENEPTALTCVFSYDISVTKENFEVVRLDGKGPNVASCSWSNDKVECSTATGFDVNKTVTDRVIIRLPQATRDHTGKYACRLQGSDKGDFTSCTFIVEAGDPHNDSSAAVAAGVAVSLLAVIAFITTILFVLLRRGKIKCKQPPFLQRFFKKQEEGSEEAQQMMPKKSRHKKDETTKKLLTFLSDDFIRLYPDFETQSYVVPPLYFNRNTYTEENIGGQPVYITQPPDDDTVKHDMAMARVLHSLRLLVEEEKQEPMFVISQFNYDDYLATLGQDFLGHKLSMPTSQKSEDKNFGDFDILIVHRHHGVLVGVVEACGDDPWETNDSVFVQKLRKSCEQLNNADCMLNHLMPYDQDKIDIHKLLMLPNLSQDGLERILQGYGDMAKDLATCLGMSESSDLHNECLCAEHMDNPDGINKLKDLLVRRLIRSKDNTPFTVDQYVRILSRFCGSATRWSVNIPGGPRNAILSTTFKDSVSMTGDFFSAPVLQPEQWEVLNGASPLMFLTGPPSSGKTRMLVLAGIQWMSEGHTVHTVSTSNESLAATCMIHEELSWVLEENRLPGEVSLVVFENEDIKERVRQMKEKAANGSLYIIADEPESYKKQPDFKAFVDRLQKEVPRLHLWAASYFTENAPECCQTHAFTKSLTCPPSILLQADVTKAASECGLTAWRPDMRTTAPTEGPAIKFVYHSDNRHKGNHPGVCEECATEVEGFLRTLPICDEADCSRETDASSHLHYKDILVLFETTIDQINTPMCKALANSGIKVKVLDKNNPIHSAMSATNDEVLVTRGRHMLGIKKKIVIYVQEKWTLFHRMPPHWKRLRGLTSSTSQLIWVQN